MTTSTTRSQPNGEYITRPEFETFSRSVESNFTENRNVLHTLGSKIDNLATKGIDLKGIFAGVSILITVILAVVGLFGWGLNDRINNLDSSIEKSDYYIKEYFGQSLLNVKKDFEAIWTQVEGDRLFFLDRTKDRWTRTDVVTFILPEIEKLRNKVEELQKEVNKYSTTKQ